MPQPLIELGGAANAPVMTIAPGNGFVPQTYAPMLMPFTASYRVVSLPPRALWGEGAPPEIDPDNISDWRHLSYDLLKGLYQFGLDDIVAVGHSFGGLASMLAAIKQPHSFKALIMLDPTLLHLNVLNIMRQALDSGDPAQIKQHPLAQKAYRRRNHFESIDEIIDRYTDKPPFADWHPDALRAFAEYGTVERDDGTRTLTWSPAWEAYYYCTPHLDIWDEVPKLTTIDVPVLVVSGTTSDTFVPESAGRVREMLPNAAHRQVDGGHLFPHSAPEATAAVIREWLQTL